MARASHRFHLLYPPQTWPLESVSLAGWPFTTKEHAVVVPVCGLMPKVQVQDWSLLVQTRFMFMMVHCEVAAIWETASSTGAAKAVAEEMAAMRAMESFILNLWIARLQRSLFASVMEKMYKIF